MVPYGCVWTRGTSTKQCFANTTPYTPEDVQCQLAGKTVFTILDEKDGYWQIKLDEESADLCTFNTPWGRYQFTRLPFGIKSASEVFQQTNTESFGDIAGVHIIVDDMIIASATKEEHDDILQQVRKDMMWQRQPEHQAALDRLKAAISNTSMLKFFNPREEVEIQADSSKDGLGAVLMQGKRPIAFASRALSTAEQNYA